jgi:hypothetical protein
MLNIFVFFEGKWLTCAFFCSKFLKLHHIQVLNSQNDPFLFFSFLFFFFFFYTATPMSHLEVAQPPRWPNGGGHFLGVATTNFFFSFLSFLFFF